MDLLLYLIVVLTLVVLWASYLKLGYKPSYPGYTPKADV